MVGPASGLICSAAADGIVTCRAGEVGPEIEGQQRVPARGGGIWGKGRPSAPRLGGAARVGPRRAAWAHLAGAKSRLVLPSLSSTTCHVMWRQSRTGLAGGAWHGHADSSGSCGLTGLNSARYEALDLSVSVHKAHTCRRPRRTDGTDGATCRQPWAGLHGAGARRGARRGQHLRHAPCRGHDGGTTAATMTNRTEPAGVLRGRVVYSISRRENPGKVGKYP